MPPIQKKLTSFPVSKKPLKLSGSSQRRLEELKKVVSIKGGPVNFDVEELATAKEVLESKDSSIEEILDSLRRLSCFQITGAMLRTSSVAYCLRPLKKHNNAEVARIASALSTKWKTVIMSQTDQSRLQKLSSKFSSK